MISTYPKVGIDKCIEVDNAFSVLQGQLGSGNCLSAARIDLQPFSSRIGLSISLTLVTALNCQNALLLSVTLMILFAGQSSDKLEIKSSGFKASFLFVSAKRFNQKLNASEQS